MKNPTVLVIFGVSGDLAQRKLLPAIGQMATLGELPEHFRILGTTRRSDVSFDALLAKTANADFVRERIELFQWMWRVIRIMKN